MQRLLSIVLALVIGLTAGLGPAIAETSANAPRSGWTGQIKPIDDTRLPACCRRGGAHHCVMGSPATSDVTTISASGCCPCWPRAMAFAVEVFAPIPATANPLRLAVESHSPHAAVIAAGISQRRTWPKRGPPSSQTLSI